MDTVKICQDYIGFNLPYTVMIKKRIKTFLVRYKNCMLLVNVH